MTDAANEKRETWIDKSTWGDGPWQDEPDRAEWVDPTTGLTCLVLRANPRMGNLCGYVAVPPDHPLQGAHPDSFDVDVHGGLTHAGPCMEDDRPQAERVCHVPPPGEPGDVWWFGFDCGHGFDRMPAIEADIGGPMLGATYRPLAYVVDQCTRLARQLATDPGEEAARLAFEQREQRQALAEARARRQGLVEGEAARRRETGRGDR